MFIYYLNMIRNVKYFYKFMEVGQNIRTVNLNYRKLTKIRND